MTTIVFVAENAIKINTCQPMSRQENLIRSRTTLFSVVQLALSDAFNYIFNIPSNIGSIRTVRREFDSIVLSAPARLELFSYPPPLFWYTYRLLSGSLTH